MTEPDSNLIDQLLAVRKEVEMEVLRDDWETASRISGMFSVHNIRSVLCSVDYMEDGDKKSVPAVAIPVDQYKNIVKMLTAESRTDDD